MKHVLINFLITCKMNEFPLTVPEGQKCLDQQIQYIVYLN